jgi:hypothetical protein
MIMAGIMSEGSAAVFDSRCRFSAGRPDDLGGDRMIGGVPAVAGEQPHGGFTPETAPVLAQGFE